MGFVDLGDINNHLARFEQSLHEDGNDVPVLAKSMVVMMVKGLFTKLQFACTVSMFESCWRPIVSFILGMCVQA